SLTHLIVPLLAIFDWVLFDKKGRYTLLDPIRWLILPLVYFGFVLVAGPLGLTYDNGKHYPYGFIDVDQNGLGAVLTTAALITLAFIVLGYLIWFVDSLLGKRKLSNQG